MSEIRVHHYRFAHVVLAGAARDFGPRLLDEPPPHGYERSLVGMWNGFGESLPPEERLPSDGLSGRLVERAGHKLLLVTMPAPVAAAEAYFVAIVRPRGASACRFLTLERSVNPLDGSLGTVLGEWVIDGHLNLGEGPDPQAALFLDAIDALLARASSRKPRSLFRRG